MNYSCADQLTRTGTLIAGLLLLLCFPASSFAQVTTAITSSGLNTQVSAPTMLPSGQVNFNITGGTRPGNGTNLFHSFGDFSVGANNIANFLNNTGLPTTNILSRVTGGNPSNIFGTLQTTGFGSANLFLVNPAGVVFGSTASLNVGGSVHVSTANYVKLTDGTRFNAVPGPQDALLSSAPVEAFGFLGSGLSSGQAGMITVQPGATLTVATGQTLSLVGRDNPSGAGQQAGIAISGGSLEAEAGRVNLVSVGKPQQPNKGGEISATDFSPSPTLSFKSMGTVSVTDGATISTSTNGTSSGLNGGIVFIRGGELVLADSHIAADGIGNTSSTSSPGGTIEVHVDKVTLDHAIISANSDRSNGGQMLFHDLVTLSSTASTLEASPRSGFANDATARGGSITIGSSTTKSVTLTETNLSANTFVTFCCGGPPPIGQNAGDITVTGREVNINGGTFDTSAGGHSVREGGLITINGDRITLENQASLRSQDLSGGGGGGVIVLQGLNSTETTPTNARFVFIGNSSLSTSSAAGPGGTIAFHADQVTLNNATLAANSSSLGGTINLADVGTLKSTNSILNSSDERGGGTIILGSLNTRSILLQNTTLSVRAGRFESAAGGVIDITASKRFKSDGSTLDASSELGIGGTVSIHSWRLSVTDGSTVTAQGAGPGQEGAIQFEFGKKLTVTDSVVTPDATIVSGWSGE